jgi:hypothetical protein
MPVAEIADVSWGSPLRTTPPPFRPDSSANNMHSLAAIIILGPTCPLPPLPLPQSLPCALLKQQDELSSILLFLSRRLDVLEQDPGGMMTDPGAYISW